MAANGTKKQYQSLFTMTSLEGKRFSEENVQQV